MLVNFLDPELGAALAGTAPRDFAGLGIEGVRTNAAARRAAARVARLPDPRVVMAEHSTPGGVKLRRYEPAGSMPETLTANDRPVVIWFHGGGYMLGGYEDNAELLEGFVIDTGCVAISVEYRLAPEHPYPVLYDAVVLLCSKQGARELASMPAARDFVADAYAHCKFIGHVTAAAELLEAAGVASKIDGEFIAFNGAKASTAFVRACTALRFWTRERACNQSGLSLRSSDPRQAPITPRASHAGREREPGRRGRSLN